MAKMLMNSIKVSYDGKLAIFALKNDEAQLGLLDDVC